MAEPTLIAFKFDELAEILVKNQGIHDGLWGVFVRFGIGAANVATPNGEMRPTALVPVLEIGLQKFDEASNLTVDAAKINPASKSAKSIRRGRKSR